MKDPAVQEKMYDNLKQGFVVQKEVGKALRNDPDYTRVDNNRILSIIEKILNSVANELREKHFKRSTSAEKFKDLSQELKKNPTKPLFSLPNVKKAFNIVIEYKKDIHPSHSSYNPFIEIKYKEIYRNVFENMVLKEKEEEEEDEL